VGFLFLLWMCAYDGGRSDLIHAHEPHEPETKEAMVYSADAHDVSLAIDLLGGAYEFVRASSVAEVSKAPIPANILRVNFSNGQVIGDPKIATTILLQSSSSIFVDGRPKPFLDNVRAVHGESIVIDRKGQSSHPIQIVIVNPLRIAAPVPQPLQLDPTPAEWNDYRVKHKAWERGEDISVTELKVDHPLKIRIP
jgi:hypothetical protein